MSNRHTETRKRGDISAKAETKAELAELGSAICIYLVGERRGGATIAELARLSLGGRTPSEEVPRVSNAVSQLDQAGDVTMEGSMVYPGPPKSPGANLGLAAREQE